MTSEEMEKAIQFILQQQAQFWTSLKSLEGIVRDHTAQIGQLTGRVDELAGLVLRLGRIVEEQGRSTDEHFNLLAESQRRTDERLNTLINVVERYFSNGHKQ